MMPIWRRFAAGQTVRRFWASRRRQQTPSDPGDSSPITARAERVTTPARRASFDVAHFGACPERAQQISPGHRPGFPISNHIQALKGRHNRRTSRDAETARRNSGPRGSDRLFRPFRAIPSFVDVVPQGVALGCLVTAPFGARRTTAQHQNAPARVPQIDLWHSRTANQPRRCFSACRQ
jgi:hypothetical protein